MPSNKDPLPRMTAPVPFEPNSPSLGGIASQDDTNSTLLLSDSLLDINCQKSALNRRASVCHCP